MDSLYTSKLRYGLPLFGKIKWKETEVQEKWLTDLQLNQNKMLRFPKQLENLRQNQHKVHSTEVGTTFSLSIEYSNQIRRYVEGNSCRQLSNKNKTL